jgi:hypothetical protein
MNTYEYLFGLFGAHSLLKNDETLSKLVTASSECYDIGDIAIKEFFKYQAHVVEGRVSEKLESLSKAIRGFQLGDTILKLNGLHAQLETYASSLGAPTSETVRPLLHLLREVISAYEIFIMNPSLGTVHNCMISVRELDREHADVVKILNQLTNLAFPELAFEGNSELSISFSWTRDYQQLIAKLISISNLYSEVCTLLNISTSEYPLKVIRAEYGSLWLRLFGESKVITLLTTMIESGVSYLHRNFTNEGKVEAIPKKVSAVEEILQLSAKLEEAGIDTVAMKENIQKSAVIISRELNTLLLREPNVTINGKTYSVGQEGDDKFLKEKLGLYLTAGDDAELYDDENEET